MIRPLAITIGMGFLCYAFPASLQVTNTNDAGPGSLRQAITDANLDPDPDTIQFDIAGVGPHRIMPSNALPIIVHSTITDGYSQTGAEEATGASPAVMKIELDGRVLSGAADEAFTLQGLSVMGGDYGVYVHSGGASNSVIRGNDIGVDASGTNPQPNSADGIYSRG